MDQGGSVPLVHVAAFDWRSLPSSHLPRPAATAVIDGERGRVNWTSHGDWRRGSVVVQGHMSMPMRFGSSDVATSYRHGAGWMQRPRPRLTDGSLRSRTLVVVHGKYTDLLRADKGVRIIDRSTNFYTVTKI